jgi:hypothetical protein
MYCINNFYNNNNKNNKNNNKRIILKIKDDDLLNDDANDCIICLENKVNNITPSQFRTCLTKLNYFCHCNCNCFMHSQCLHDWIITKQVCPICRQKINTFTSFVMTQEQNNFYQKVNTIRNNLQLRLRERFRLASAHSHKILFVLQTIIVIIVNFSIIYIIINSFFLIAFALLL